MKVFIFLFLMIAGSALADAGKFSFVTEQLSLEGAMEVARHAQKAAKKLNKTISLAIVGSQGETILLLKGDGVGPHNTEAARRKAYTALSTKTSTLELSRKAQRNPDTVNLAELPELLLLSGGYPIWKGGIVIGAVGVAGGGSPENDDVIAMEAGVFFAGRLKKK